MELSLDEVLKNMKELQHKYEIKCVMYNKNKLSVKLKAIEPKDILVEGGRLNNDKILNMLAREEELTTKLEGIITAYNLYREMAINILVEYSMTKPIDEMIVIYRDKMKFKWDDIAKLVHYSSRQVIRIYNQMSCHVKL